jgi:putative ABC transport system permease protein
VWRVARKNLFAHRVRLLLTTLSVVLGVAFVSGTYVLTDTMSRVFDDMVRGGSQSVDVLVRSAGDGDTDIGTDASYYGATPLPAELLDLVVDVEGVERAEGTAEGYAMVVRPDGEAIVPMGPPTLGGLWSEAGNRVVREGGRAPRDGGEVVVDATTADRNDLAVGDRVSVVFSGIPPRDFTVVGITETEGGEDLAGATYVQFDPETAQEVLGLEDAYTGISVWHEEGVTADELVDRLTAALPADVQAISSADFADETMAEIEESLGFFTVALGVFAAIALVVGAFIIANTFSITVVQRTREFALLRALGASRRQVIGTVVGEAVIVGILASVLGVLAGVGLAAGLQQLLKAFGMDLPTGSLVLQPRTVVIALVVGVLVTVLSSLLPARRAAAVHPVAALREAGVTAYRPSRARLGAGIVAGVGAVALVAVGALVQPTGAGTMVGIGAVLALVALGATGPALTRPVLRVLGGTGEHLGTTGRLARGNSMRTPRRTWTTAAALTVGLALVSSVAVMAASMKASMSDAIQNTLVADLVVIPSNSMMGGTLPAVIAEQVAELPEVGAVSPVRYGLAQVDGERALVLSVDAQTWDDVAVTTVAEGSFPAIAPVGTVAVDTELAAEEGYAIGDVVTGAFASVGESELRVEALYEPDEVLAGFVVSTVTYDTLFPGPLDSAVLIVGATDTDVAALRTAVETVAAAYPAATIQDQAQYRETIAGQVDQMLALVTALLGMALFIAVLGIMNTLALSIHERTREIGLLRAVGMTRRQVRRMVRWEAVTVALLGSVVGLVLGTGLGWAATRVLDDGGLARFVLPGGQLLGAVLLALLAGVLAAIIPARNAARLDVLRAVTVE